MAASDAWRQLLPRLAGLPLLPIGAGDQSKAPAHPRTGEKLTGWTTAAYTPEQVAAACAGVIAAGFRPGPDAGDLIAFDIDGATALAFCRSHPGCDPLEAPTWQVRRDTDPDRLKVIWRIPPDLRDHLELTVSKHQTKPPSRRGAGDGENVATYYGSGQVIVLGQHPSSGGNYFWPQGHGPESVAEITPEWWGLALEIAASTAPSGGTASKGTSKAGDWRRITGRCPICGRDRSHACQIHRDGQSLLCYIGSSFQPPELEKGELVPGTEWAYAGPKTCWADFSLFVIDKPREPRYDSPAEVRSRQGAPTEPPRSPMNEERKPRQSDQEKLSALRQAAADLLEEGAAFADRLPLLRGRAQLLEITLRDDELRRLIWDARRAAAGTIEPLTPGDRIDLSPCPWYWEGVIMLAALNLLVALPKIGKTSLMLALIGAWHRGEPAFLGLRLIGSCPPVLIVGTDQPSSDWGRMLQEVGLLGPDGELRAPIVALYHRGRPLHLDPEGIERIASHAEQHPGLFVLLDSIAALTGPLGIDENSAEIAEPIADLLEAVEPHGATLVAIHHAGKVRAGESAVLASRGNTALPAVASQIISLARLSTGAPGAAQDRRIVMKTDGRGGLPQQLLIERTEEGWISHGSAESVALAQHLQALEEKLTDRQAEALDLVRSRWAAGERTDAKALAAAMGSSCERIARRTLDALTRRGLLQSSMEAEPAGRRKWFWPVGVEEPGGVRTPSRGGIGEVSEVSEVSEPLTPSHGGSDKKGLSYVSDPSIPPRTSDTSDRKDAQDNTPREGVRTPSDAAAAPARFFHQLPPPEVQGRLLWFHQQFPKEHPHTLAGRLDPFGDAGIDGRKVRSWLEQLEELDEWDRPDPIPPAEVA